MKSIRYLNIVLTVLAGLLTAQLYTTWTQSPSLVSRADAAIPDAGAQRDQIISQLKLLNRKQDDLQQLFKTGQAKVTLVKQDND